MKIDLESVQLYHYYKSYLARVACVTYFFWLVLHVQRTPPLLFSPGARVHPRFLSIYSKTLASAAHAESCHDLKGLKELFQNVSQR